jgi:hypothetical protein
MLSTLFRSLLDNSVITNNLKSAIEVYCNNPIMIEDEKTMIAQ